MVTGTGSVSGPTHAMAIYLEMFHRFPERWWQCHRRNPWITIFIKYYMHFLCALSITLYSPQLPNIVDLCRWHSWKSFPQWKHFSPNSLARFERIAAKITLLAQICLQYVNRNTSANEHMLSEFVKRKYINTSMFIILREQINRNLSEQIYWLCCNNLLMEIHQLK